jgi:hypothetical protein
MLVVLRETETISRVFCVTWQLKEGAIIKATGTINGSN